MTKFTSVLAIATAATAISATSAFAVTVTPFATPLSAGENTLGDAAASAFEDFGMTTLSLEAADDLIADVSITVNPFATDVQGNPGNSIDVAFSVNGGAFTTIALTSLIFPPVAAAGLSIALDAGDVLSFGITGTAGQSGNQVTFAVETGEVPVPAVPVLPAGYLALTGLAALGATRMKKKSK